MHNHTEKLEIIVIIIILMHLRKKTFNIYLGLYHLPREALYHFASSIR